jgi:hypothetical protein
MEIGQEQKRIRTQGMTAVGDPSLLGEGTRPPSRTARQALHTRGLAFKKETFPLARQL